MKNLKYAIIVIVVAVWMIHSGYSSHIRTEIKKNNKEGLACLNRGQYAEAIQKFEKAYNSGSLSINDKIKLLRNLAVAYEHDGNLEQAVLKYNEAAEMASPQSYMHNICKADAYMLEGELKNAVEYLNLAVIQNPDVFIPYNNLGLIYIGVYGDGLIDLDKALKYNLKAWELNGDINTQFILGKNYYLLNDYQKAEPHLSKVTGDVPQQPEYHYYLGLTQYYLGKKSEGVDHLTTAVMSSPIFNTLEVEKIIDEQKKKAE